MAKFVSHCEASSLLRDLNFFDKWYFSASLNERLNKFRKSSSYEVSMRCTVENNETDQEEVTMIDENVQVDQKVGSDSVGSDINTENSSVHETLQHAPDPQYCTEFMLHERPFNDEELYQLTEEKLITILDKASDTVIYNFCESICLSQMYPQRLIQILCENYLLPKIRNDTFDNLSRTLLNAIRKIFEKFPSDACNYILLPIIHDSELLCKLDPVLCNLDVKSKQAIFKSLLEGNFTVIEEYHVSLLQTLLTASVDLNTSELLIDLMLTGTNLCKSTKFGKLLVCVTKQIGPLLQTESRHKLRSVIESHKSFQKILAVKAFESLDL